LKLLTAISVPNLVKIGESCGRQGENLCGPLHLSMMSPGIQTTVMEQSFHLTIHYFFT